MTHELQCERVALLQTRMRLAPHREKMPSVLNLRLGKIEASLLSSSKYIHAKKEDNPSSLTFLKRRTRMNRL